MASLAAMGLMEWSLPALAQGEEIIAFTDLPANFTTAGRGGRSLDTRTVQPSAFITPVDDFYLVQHYGQPTVDPATYKLRLTGFVSRPVDLTLDQLKRRPRAEVVAGFEHRRVRESGACPVDRVVRGRVVDEHERIGVAELGKHRSRELVDRAAAVVRDHDDHDVGIRHAATSTATSMC